MKAKNSEKVIVRHVDHVRPVPCPCGESTRVLTVKDTSRLNFHRTEIVDSVRHYHRNTAEVYYVLQGEARMILDEEEIELRPGLCVYIPPGTRHEVRGKVQSLVIGVPPLQDEDEFFD
jgi:mannose-6-phosphate isomerase-like protein (cupin superfamily)